MGRLHALWVLRGLGALDEELVTAALSDSIARVRENALVLAEAFLPSSSRLAEHVMARANDDSARVRFQAALTFGALEQPAARDALRRILDRDLADRWIRLAVLSSLPTGEGAWLIGALTQAGDWSERTGALELGRELADLCGARAKGAGGGTTLRPVLEALNSPGVSALTRVAVLEGLVEGLRRAPEPLAMDRALSHAVMNLMRETSPGLLAAAWRLANELRLPPGDVQRRALVHAKHAVTDAARPLADRLEQVRLLGLGSFAEVGDVLLGRLTGGEPAGLQREVVVVLRRYSDLALAERLIQRWRSLAPSVRAPVLNLLLQRPAFHGAVVTALESGQVNVGELNLDLEQRRRLLRRGPPEVTARAARLITDEEYGHRRAIVDQWMARLPNAGKPAAGQPVFQRLCSSCHAVGGGSPAGPGPDLATIAHRSVEDLVSNILDPNLAINPAYATYEAETKDGEVETGVVGSESPEAVVLLQALGRRVTLARASLRRLEATGLSLMPEGLEAGMTPEELRDLIAYLQVPR
jgi:putative heme-binding domain-containing protein